jgi:hypothetical protein
MPGALCGPERTMHGANSRGEISYSWCVSMPRFPPRHNRRSACFGSGHGDGFAQVHVLNGIEQRHTFFQRALEGLASGD